MRVDLSWRWISPVLAIGIVALAAARMEAGTRRAPVCQRLELAGEVAAGQEWRSALGEGWVFRLVPILPGKSGYSGWDLVVDREQSAGFPDALLLATPPYNSINEREVGTTYGLRAQDAIGWNPRSFRFLANPTAFAEAQKLYLALSRDGQARRIGAAQASGRMMELEQHAAAGQFHIADARLAPGIADAASYAETWALASPKTPHTLEPATGGKPTPMGQLHWMRFSVTLWLPATWKASPGSHVAEAACSE